MKLCITLFCSLLDLCTRSLAANEFLRLRHASAKLVNRTGDQNDFENTTSSQVQVSRNRSRATSNLSADAEWSTFLKHLDKMRVSMYAGSGTLAEGAARTVWIVGIGRSGTTLLQEILEAAAVGQGASTFAAFEPCHPRDLYRGVAIGYTVPSVARQDCIRRVLQCDFDNLISFLPDGFTKTDGFRNQEGLMGGGGFMVSQMCKSSSVRIIKTIYPVATSSQFVNEAASGANVHVIRLTRDPRATYASMKAQPPENIGFARFTIALMCQIQAKWAAESPSGGRSLLQVKFEHLVTKHEDEVPRILQYLQWKESSMLSNYLNMHISSPYCNSYDPFATCRTPEQTRQTLQKWRQQLSYADQAQFTQGLCASATAEFGYQ